MQMCYLILVVNTEKTKYLAVARHRGMTTNEYIKVRYSSYEEVKTSENLGPLFYSRGN